MYNQIFVLVQQYQNILERVISTFYVEPKGDGMQSRGLHRKSSIPTSNDSTAAQMHNVHGLRRR